jgi:hypothetical protein
MKIENWCFNQSSTGMLDKPVRTEVSFVTNDDVDRNKLLEHIKLYDGSTTELIDADFYWRMKKFAEDDEKLHDFYRGRRPDQIKEVCDGIYERIHELVGRNVRSPQVNWEYRKLSVGIEILREYNIWWTPPTKDENNTGEEDKNDE